MGPTMGRTGSSEGRDGYEVDVGSEQDQWGAERTSWSPHKDGPELNLVSNSLL